MNDKKLLVADLGLIDYVECRGLQLKLVNLRAEKRIPDVLLLLEHSHIITLGRRSDESDARKIDGIPVLKVDRGGRATYHGPGQLVGYMIIDLIEFGADVKTFVHLIEEAIIRTLKRFGLMDADRREGYPGVWIKKRKIASIGLGIKHWITYHGFALNVNTDLKYFELINPCGLNPNTMTSMERELGKRVDMREVKSSFLENFAETFGYGEMRKIGLESLFRANSESLKIS